MRKVLILWDRRDVIRTRDLCVPKNSKYFLDGVNCHQIPLNNGVRGGGRKSSW